MRVYFDNAATTQVSPEVAGLVQRTMREDYANPSSKHIMGVEAERYVKEAAETIAGTLKCREKEIIFTSGGTESNNMALIGTALAKQRQGRHIITTGIEHASVYEPLLFLESLGFEFTALPVDGTGHVKLDALKESLREDTILVSTMMVNNEIGSIEPVEEISRIIKAFGRAHDREIYYHVDAIQAYGKLQMFPKRMGIDMLSVSSHKLHGPKGVGFLYVDEKVRIRPIIYGGGQQHGMRSGTINVPGIAGLGLAAREAYDSLGLRNRQMISVRDLIIDEVSRLEDVKVNTEKTPGFAPHIVSISAKGVRAQVLLNALEKKGICVSSGSACSTHHPGISGTLKGIGLAEELLDSTIRVSLCELNTKEEAEYFISTLGDLIPQLRRFTRK